ncbi:DUF3078 domain-containing protein [bacterium]|nr:DUF3078 domain-containing protein [bacterium]MBU1985025.1 DUF3078 domain-containing protein [bacterium]
MKRIGYAGLRIVLVLILAVSVAAAQETTPAQKWKVQIESGLGVTQAAYSDNWTGGESGSILWASAFRGKAEKQISPSWYWGNELKLAFGQTHNQVKVTDSLGVETKKWTSPQKSTDKIRYDGILRLTRGWVVDPYAAGVFESQFLDASGTRKRYVNPVDLTETMGVARDVVKIPDRYVLTTRFGAGFRQRFICRDDPADPAKTISESSNDGGLEWVTDFALGSAKSKYSFLSKLTLFQALFYSKADELKGLPNEDYWKTADLNWDNVLTANVTSILQVSLAWQLLYDKEIDLGGRLKETLTLGVAYKFANFVPEKK